MFKKIGNSKSLKYTAISFFLFDLAGGFSGIFLPIYFLQIGLSINQILMILFLTFAIIGTLPILLLKFFSRVFERILTCGIFFALLFFVALLLTKNPIILGLLQGLYVATFWPSFNLLRFRLTNVKNRATIISFLNVFIPTMNGIVSPLVGGYLINSLGFSSVFIIGIIFYIIAIFTSFNIKTHKVDQKIVFPKSSIFLIFALIFIIGTLTEDFWLAYPLFLFDLTKGIFNMAVFASATSLISSIIAIMIGRISDLKVRRIEFAIASAISSCAYFLALSFVKIPLHLLPVAILGGVTAAFATPSFALIADSFRRKYHANVIAIREIFLMFGRFVNIFLMFLFIINFQFQNYFLTLGVLTTLSIPLYLTLRIKYKLK